MIFNWLPDPRALPSFPTRRSSDLRIEGPRLREHDARSLRLEVTARRRESSGRGEDPRAVQGLGRPDGGVPRLPRRDRKSTRLNSSHVAISYAAFCLKKKK